MTVTVFRYLILLSIEFYIVISQGSKEFIPNFSFRRFNMV